MFQDVQTLADTRGVILPEVGIEDLRYPLLIADRQGGKREVIATVAMSVSNLIRVYLDARVALL